MKSIKTLILSTLALFAVGAAHANNEDVILQWDGVWALHNPYDPYPNNVTLEISSLDGNTTASFDVSGLTCVKVDFPLGTNTWLFRVGKEYTDANGVGSGYQWSVWDGIITNGNGGATLPNKAPRKCIKDSGHLIYGNLHSFIPEMEYGDCIVTYNNKGGVLQEEVAIILDRVAGDEVMRLRAATINNFGQAVTRYYVLCHWDPHPTTLVVTY